MIVRSTHLGLPPLTRKRRNSPVFATPRTSYSGVERPTGREREATALKPAAEAALRLAYPRLSEELRDLRRTQWLAAAPLRELSWFRLRQTLAHAYAFTPFYRGKFDRAGIAPGDIRTPADLLALPTTTKDELRRALEERSPLSSEIPPGQTQLLYTTGSTGQPLSLPIDRSAKHRRMAVVFRDIEWYGHGLGDRNARLWGPPASTYWRRSRVTNVARLMERFKVEIVGRRLELRTHDPVSGGSGISEHQLNAWADRLRRYRPKVIDGYVSALALLAKHVQQDGLIIPGCRAVVTGGEYLSGAARRLIEGAFQAPVYERYGGTEAGCVAHECGLHPRHQLHVNAEALWLELINDNRHAAPGELGRVVITDFTNRATPLIRYELGDLGTAADSKEACPCGRGLPLVDKIQGRVNDLFYLPDGQVVVSHVWHDLFHQAFVEQFQVRQQKGGAVEVQLVMNTARLDTRAYQDLQRRVQKVLPGIDVVWRVVDHISLGPGAKRRYSISEADSHLNELRSEGLAAVS
jgi:phenylacetate-CoA ligase